MACLPQVISRNQSLSRSQTTTVSCLNARPLRYAAFGIYVRILTSSKQEDGRWESHPCGKAERRGWARLSDLFRRYDQARVQDVKEDMDTLLVFVRVFNIH